MKKLLVLDIIGLSKKQLDTIKPPNILQIFENGFQTVMLPTFPAVTCSVQASITSGYTPAEHGIISNGFYDHNSKQVFFWEQSSNLVTKPRIWDILKKVNPNLKTAVLFWQNSLFINSDIVITPKPIHQDNGIVMWCYSKPVNYYENIVEDIGDFDLQWYWGPLVSIKSSLWILEATKYTIKNHSPNLVLVYLPHLDYAAQKNGPESEEFKKALLELDTIIGDISSFLSSYKNDEYEIMIISEYSFNNVKNSISPNKILREEGLLSIRNISGKEYIDFEYSKAFAMVDHQIAHIFTKPAYENQIENIFNHQTEISEILNKDSQKELKINNPKSGNLILCSKEDSWFNYYWWDDSNKAPEFTFNVDIHRKPGYDPLELFFDPQTKKISQNTSLIKGSHGLINKNQVDELPVFGMTLKQNELKVPINAVQIAQTISKFFNINTNLPGKSII